MKKDIFISYTTKDKGVADVLVEYLEGLRYSCFIAPRDIDPGKAYDYDKPWRPQKKRIF